MKKSSLPPESIARLDASHGQETDALPGFQDENAIADFDWRFLRNPDAARADSRFWKNSNDDEIVYTIKYAERWAQIMQRSMRNRRTIEAVWKGAAAQAIKLVEEQSALDNPENTAVIHSRMQYKASRLICRYWLHGDALDKALRQEEQGKESNQEHPIPDGIGEIYY